MEPALGRFWNGEGLGSHADAVEDSRDAGAAIVSIVECGCGAGVVASGVGAALVFGVLFRAVAGAEDVCLDERKAAAGARVVREMWV
jgi:hypothetical protein